MSPTPFPRTHRQPYKALEIISRIAALPVLVPAWYLQYLLFPSTRGRRSWSPKEALFVRFGKYAMPLIPLCNIPLLVTNKTKAPPSGELKETHFLWLEPAREQLVKGIALDPHVQRIRVPGYVWPQGAGLNDGEGLVGLWIHGGGYMMGNGKESFGEADIARQLLKRTKIDRILSVDYRVVTEGCHPAQLLDALAAYAHLVQECGINPSKIVVIGACAGGHLALLLTRYLYEEKVLPMPVGLMLFSPWVDMYIDKVCYEDPKAPNRTNLDVDLLTPYYFSNLLFLGHHSTDLLSSPYLSANLAPPGSFNSYTRTFLSVGEVDGFRQECDQLAAAMTRDGADCTYDVQADAVHDFAGIPFAPSDKARENVYNRAKEWLDGIPA